MNIKLCVCVCERERERLTFFCTTIEEDDIHRLITCPLAKAIWVLYITNMGIFIEQCLFVSPFKWVFIDGVRCLPTLSYQVAFDYLRYSRMWYNWSLGSGFMFDGLCGVPQQSLRSKGKLISQFS